MYVERKGSMVPFLEMLSDLISRQVEVRRTCPIHSWRLKKAMATPA